MIVACRLPAAGSSPLTRGKPSLYPAFQPPPGLIPAHAGKTLLSRLILSPRWAHPRSRGENPFHRCALHRLTGSSPLTRGKLTGPDNLCSFVRLIPAHAGKTVGAGLRIVLDRAHPRSRGENRPTASSRMYQKGSSPLTRGKLVRAGYERKSMRLIPAHAGKTRQKGHLTRARQAHPRSRGENSSGLRPSGSGNGSSPLTRGKLAALGHYQHAGGLIPAHAGKTARNRA